jgi:hypothetical protein
MAYARTSLLAAGGSNRLLHESEDRGTDDYDDEKRDGL